MKRIFIATSTFGEDNPRLLKELAREQYSVTMNPHRRRLNEEEITGILVEGAYEGLLAGLEPLTQEVLVKARHLKVISRVGVGLDNVDQDAAHKQGIKVFNTPGVLTDAVAELTLGLMLAALRNIVFSDRKIRGGQWSKKMGILLKGKTLGLVGFGHIGQRVAQLALAFGAKVIFCDIQSIKKAGVKHVSFLNLMKLSDIISLHSSSAECLISDKEIELFKPGVILVNTARGRLIDEAALINGLASGKIAVAALDVFEQEPYQGNLTQNDQVILTAHVGSYAKEARMQMENMAVKNLIKGLKGRSR